MDQQVGPGFLAGGGECGAMMRAHDWSTSPLGEPAAWPQPLRTIAGVVLAANQPMFAVWGPEQAMIYNDAYAQILGGHHPAALGRPFFEAWSELVDSVGPIMERGYAGEPTYMDDLALVMHRKGFPEETHFSFFYAPVRDEVGRVGGVVCACTETTAQVFAGRRQAFRLALEERLRDFADPREAMDAAARALGEHLGVGCVGYSEADEAGGRVTVERHWTAPGAVGVVGTHRLGSYGPAIIAEFKAGRTVRVDDVVGNPMTAGAPGAYEAIDTRAFVNVPLVRAGRFSALLFVLSALPRVWTDDEVALIEEVAERTWAVVERARAEAALRESEDNYRHAVDLSPQTVWTARPDGQLDHVGTRWREWTGTSGLGASWGDAVHPDDLAPSVAAWTRAVTSGEPYDIEHRVRFRDGSYRWMHSRAYPRRDETGGIARWYGTTEDIHGARMAEEALRESEARFRNMADNAPVMMWVTDPSGYCTYLNKRWYEFTGQSVEESLGLGWTKATHPDDEDLAAETFLSANAAQAPFRVEYRLRRADGAYRWAIDAASPRFGEDGAFLGYVGSVIDIDERREAEERLRQSEAEARRLAAQQAATLGQLAEGVIVTDAAGRITLINDAATRLHGVKRLDVAPDAYSATYSLWTEDGRPYPSPELPLARAVRGETVLEARWVIKRPNGRKVLAVGNARPVLDGAGRQIGAVLTIRDDTARRVAEEELERLNASLEAAVVERTRERDRLWEVSEDLLVVGDYEGRLLRVSPSWTRLLGHDEATLLARPHDQIVHPDDLEAVMDALSAMRSGDRPVSFENRARAADGTWRWIAWTLSPEPGGQRFTGVGRDVTAAKARQAEFEAAQEALRQSQKMEAVGQLTGGLAHDFNNLLTGITGSLELLNSRIRQGRLAEVDRYITAAQGAAKRAAALTHRLLAFSRRQTLDPKPTDVNRLVAGMEDLIRRTVGPAIAVEAVAAGGLWTTLVDPNQLENALLNLCINARDAMPEGGRLTIETGNKWLDQRAARERDLPPGQYVSLCVSDTGAGMAPDVARRAFDPFFTTKPIGSGTGLGLSMVYGFARQSGGLARIYSEPGQGAMVCLYLPRHFGAAEGDADLPAEAAAEAPRTERGETVLVVDDEPTVRMLVAEVLEDLGYAALEAADGAAGLEALRSSARIDLLVTDVGLPGGVNGRQVADAARALRPGLKVLFITGYAENAVLGHGHLEPGMHVLTKPFVMDALAVRIKDLIHGA